MSDITWMTRGHYSLREKSVFTHGRRDLDQEWHPCIGGRIHYLLKPVLPYFLVEMDLLGPEKLSWKLIMDVAMRSL